LPESARLTSVLLTEEAKALAGEPVAAGRGRGAGRRAREEQEANNAASRMPTENDLYKLSDHFDQHEQVLTLIGVTVNTTELHSYVARLRMSGLFSKGELKSLESVPGQESVKSQKFEVRLVLAPRHGKLKRANAAEESSDAAEKQEAATESLAQTP
jgi:hypothetical protein